MRIRTKRRTSAWVSGLKLVRLMKKRGDSEREKSTFKTLLMQVTAGPQQPSREPRACKTAEPRLPSGTTDGVSFSQDFQIILMHVAA